METAFLAEIATIVGAVSILLTLVFVVIELKKRMQPKQGQPILLLEINKSVNL